jgi:hypothetical protein
MNDKGTILMPLNGRLVTMEKYYEEKAKRTGQKRPKPRRWMWSLVGIGFILATIYLIYRLDDVARWVAGVAP